MSLNWAKLYAEGRCKDVGISWSEEEAKAVFQLKIPADYVRDGVLTLEDYSKALEQEAKDGKKSFTKMSVTELFAEAKKLNLKVTPEANKQALVRAIQEALTRTEKKAVQEAAIAKAYKIEEKAMGKQAEGMKKVAEAETVKQAEDALKDAVSPKK